MTATINPATRQDALAARLAALRADREQLLAETIPAGEGDIADRATNVDGHVRLAMLDERIASVEAELDARHRVNAPAGEHGVAVGDVVTLDFGDGPESLLIGSVEESGGGFDVITPNSPLGRALPGAGVGTTVSYAAAPRRTLSVKVIAIN
jgi:transcription elongation factor GreA